MGKIIDSDKLLPCLWDYINDCDYQKVEKVIEEIPSAEPEIIRCKDCKYLDRHTDILKMHQTDGFCMEWARDTYENWYCSRAKSCRNEVER